MRQWKGVALLVVVMVGVSSVANAQVATELHGLQSVLDGVRKEMVPMCDKLTKVGRGIAGFAALWVIASRVYKAILNAEAIDFYPLFRPFVLGFCIIWFPMVIALIDGLLDPTVEATNGMVQDSNSAVERLLKEKEDAMKTTDLWKMYVGNDEKGDKEKWLKYTKGIKGGDTTNVSEGFMESIGTDITFAMSKAQYRFQNSIKEWLSDVLQILYEAAALCINTIRTFQLIVLAILGPLVFGLAVFDGFQHTLAAWLAKYINIFLWLPVCNIFSSILGKIQEGMIKLDIGQIVDAGRTSWSPHDVAYIIFLVIGIMGYSTVPTVAGYIMNAGGNSPLVQKVTSMLSTMSPGSVVSGLGKAADTAKSYSDGKEHGWGSGVAGALGRMAGEGKSESPYMKDRLSGKS